MKLTTTDDQALTYIRALVYGNSGIGKTTSLRTLKPKADKVLICVSERGTIPLQNYTFKCLPLNSWDGVREIVSLFMAPDQIADAAIKEAVIACKILVIDGLSELHDQCIRHIVEVDKPALTTARGKGSKAEKTHEDQMAIDDWGLYRSRMLNMISAFCHLPVHVIFTCLAAWSKDKMGGETFRTPNLSGKAAIECSRYFDLVFHMEATKDQDGNNMRVWRTQNDNMIIAKDSTGVLDVFEPADWMTVFTKILGPKNGSTK
jgi:hypothetical protein